MGHILDEETEDVLDVVRRHVARERDTHVEVENALRKRLDASRSRVSELEGDVDRLVDARERIAMLVPVGHDTGTVEENIGEYVGHLHARVSELEGLLQTYRTNLGAERTDMDVLEANLRAALAAERKRADAMRDVVQDVEYLWRYRHDDVSLLPEELEEHDEEDLLIRLMDGFNAYLAKMDASEEEK